MDLVPSWIQEEGVLPTTGQDLCYGGGIFQGRVYATVEGGISGWDLCYCVRGVLLGRVYVTVGRYFRAGCMSLWRDISGWVGSMLLGGRGQGQKVTAYVDVAGENSDCIRSRREPPGGTRVHEQCLSPHSYGEG